VLVFLIQTAVATHVVNDIKNDPKNIGVLAPHQSTSGISTALGRAIQ
jgi:hypothetical protein